MPETDLEAVQRALGNICIVVDGNQQHTGPKLESVEPGSLEAYYMLAAFCFDLNRKLHYIFKVTREFAREGHTDTVVAREVKDDNDYMYDDPRVTTWKERAERAEEVLRRLAKEIHKEHNDLLDRASRRR